MESRNNTV